MVFQREDWMDTLTSSLMLSSHPMDNSVFPVHGTVPSDFGILPLVTPPEDSLATPRYVDMDFSWRDSYSMTCNLYFIIFFYLGRSLRRLLRWQPSNCLRCSRPHHQIVEHFGYLQVHHPRTRSHRMGFLCSILPIGPKPSHCFIWLG